MTPTGHAFAPICQRIPGLAVDPAVGMQLLGALTPMALEVALAVQGELAAPAEEADRLVAGVLEAEGNQKLRELTEAQEVHERQRQHDRLLLDDERRAQILAFATDFPRLWGDPRTMGRDRKRMIRLIVEDVTLLRTKAMTGRVRFKGGASRTLQISLPLPASQLRRTEAEVLH